MDIKQIKTVAKWLGTGSINIFGLPFSGKDTQGRRLADLLNAPLLGGGEILRGSQLPEHVKIHEKGLLIPREDYIKIVLPYLGQKSFAGKPLVLSSVGRWHGEELGVLDATSASGHPLKAVILLNMPEDEIWKRWEIAQRQKDRGQRADDARELLEVRLNEFHTKTLPVIDFYRTKGLLLEVDALMTPDQVTQEIITQLINKFIRN